MSEHNNTLFLADLTYGMPFDGFVLVRSAEFRDSPAGKKYLDMIARNPAKMYNEFKEKQWRICLEQRKKNKLQK